MQKDIKKNQCTLQNDKTEKKMLNKNIDCQASFVLDLQALTNFICELALGLDV